MKNPFKRALDEQIEALETLPPQSVFGQISRFVGLASILLLVIFSGIGFYWSQEPDMPPAKIFNPSPQSLSVNPPVTGTQTVQALMLIGETLLSKPGGYLSNDRLPPGLLLDNIPNWEFGAFNQSGCDRVE